MVGIWLCARLDDDDKDAVIRESCILKLWRYKTGQETIWGNEASFVFIEPARISHDSLSFFSRFDTSE